MNKAFLKWAGGKSQLLDKLTALMPPVNSTGRYIEPFVGSGVIALNMPHKHIIIGDVNEGLMACWDGLQERSVYFIDACRTHFTEKSNTAEAFYGRRQMFNETQDSILKGVLFLYLNRHCFNGLCRFNSKGGFNVPFGKYTSPHFPQAELMHALEVTKRMTICKQGFVDTMNMAKEGDVVYCDPPYLPLSETSNFVGYSKGGFPMELQWSLAARAERLRDRGATVIVSNNDVPLARKMYAKADEIHEVQVAKRISCKGDGRKKSGEIIAVYRP